MEYIRVLHPKDFDPNDGRFISVVFTYPSEGGISVFEPICAERVSRTVCEHIRLYYTGLTTAPPVYWRIDFQHLCANINLRNGDEKVTKEQKASKTGDEHCHYELSGITKSSAKRYARHFAKPPNVKICRDGEAEASVEELTAIKRRAHDN